MSSAEYEDVSDTDMDKLHERLEILCEEYGPDAWEVEYSVSRRYALPVSVSPFPLLHGILDHPSLQSAAC